MSSSASARDRLAAMLARWGGRPTLLTVAVINVVSFIVIAPYIAPANYGLDVGTFRQCAVALTQGVAYCGSPYPPLMGVAALPLSWVSSAAAAVLMPTLGITILAFGILAETRGHARIDRLLIAISVYTFTPVVYELLLGQTTILIGAAIYLVARRSDAFRNGIAIGIVLAVAPKALLAPILLWMLVWRRHALGGALLTAVVLTGVALLVMGPDPYRAWIGTVTGAGKTSLVGWLSDRDMGNLSLWPLEPVTIATAIFVAAATVVAIARDESRGFVASILGGLLLAPYTLLYGYTLVLLAVKPALAYAPRVTRGLALTVNFAHPALPSIIWTLTGLIACLFPRRSGPAVMDGAAPAAAAPASGASTAVPAEP